MKMIDNFLDVDFANELESYIIGELDKPIWMNGHSYFDAEFGKYLPDKQFPFIAHMDTKMANKLMKTLLSQGILTREPADSEALIYKAYPLSSVEWHTDKHDEYDKSREWKTQKDKDPAGISIYLNREWHPDWGGCFLLKDNHSDTHGKFYEPIFNRAIINNGRELHSVSTINAGSKNRYSVQLFLSRSALREDLQ